MNTDIKDCVIVGGGPAGLTAAIYLARFKRYFEIIDNNESRAALIPISHNYPGAVHGISGKDLLKQLREQLKRFKHEVVHDTVIEIKKTNEHFTISGEHTFFNAKTVIVATGIVDIEPILGDIKDAIKQGLIRHCPICDGYEVIDKKIAVIGYEKCALNEAAFLKTYSNDVTLLTLNTPNTFGEEEYNFAKINNIEIITDAIIAIEKNNNCISAVKTSSGNVFAFDTFYSALGAKVRSDLAIKCGAEHRDGYLLVNEKQETSVPNLYAIGDVASSLSQICVATGQAAIAAVAIHNFLANNKLT